MSENCSGADPAMLEGRARVVALNGPVAWLEPEPGTSCGGCAAAAACGAAGRSRRLAARQFPIPNPAGPERLRLGDRVLIGVAPQALLKAALAAYGLPLMGMLAAGISAQAMAGSDATAMAACVGGLAAGILLARQVAARLTRHADSAPRFLRRADAGAQPRSPAP